MTKRRLSLLLLFVATAVAAFFSSCSSSDDLSDELAPKIAAFVNQYFPNTPVAAYTHTSDGYTVELSGGPEITFDTAQEWTAVDGRGEELPQVLLFDRLPPALYSYLEETSTTKSVYGMARTSATYTIRVTNTTLTYDIETGQISSPLPPQ